MVRRGLRGATALVAAFHKAAGTTPAAYRQLDCRIPWLSRAGPEL